MSFTSKPLGMTALWQSTTGSSSPSSSNPSILTRDHHDGSAAAAEAANIADTGLADVTDVGLPSPDPQASSSTSSTSNIIPGTRPQLQRNQPAPPPPHQPPPPPSPQQIGNPSDSLSLVQLKRIVSEFPRVEPTAYAFEYQDTATFEEEIDEWFSYHDAEYERLGRAKESFLELWNHGEQDHKDGGGSWGGAGWEKQKAFVAGTVKGLDSSQMVPRAQSLEALLYVVLGVWEESAGLSSSSSSSSTAGNANVDLLQEEEEDGEGVRHVRSTATNEQIEAMKAGTKLVTEVGGVKRIYEVMKYTLERLWKEDYREDQYEDMELMFLQQGLDSTMAMLYVLIEAARCFPDELAATRHALDGLSPKLSEYFLNMTAKLRWDDTAELPQTRIFLIFWKSILLQFGGLSELAQVKKATSETSPDVYEEEQDLITASPLDYHVFRQEITSKYPAYIPPAPLIPLEPDNNSILPPLPNHSRNNGSNGILPTPVNTNSGGGSILHQPVHIATPAPSPPPSPPVGGKAGKKQNYQTNQNFPLMYPPLDSTSNSAGGKGTAGMQDLLVGRKWEGSDIPTSILEAGELFSKRTRMTRAMRQLWDEREKFLKFERGWDGHAFMGTKGEEDPEDDDIPDLDIIGEDELEEVLNKRLEKALKKPNVEPEIDFGPREIEDAEIRRRLEAVEEFYSLALPHLQSIVIVLLKAVLANVTALLSQPTTGQGGLNPSFQSEVNLRSNGLQGQRRPPDQLNPGQPVMIDPAELTTEELEAVRSREITSKAVSGILLTLLKWFKVSHILKFEYLTQLLLDSNYIPLILKLFAHQDVDKLVDSNSDSPDLSFFTFCNLNSNKPPIPEDVSVSDEDDAVPPPIKLRRTLSQTDHVGDKLNNLSVQDKESTTNNNKRPPPPPRRITSEPPSIDELGYPVTELSSSPKTDYSWRNFFSSINYLRIMQKICKNKAHRNLLLVQYKSSNILKKALKIPQHELRLYTLKLFKNQVPYCGRKWRQGNMRVITAVYLHCRPELRDDWLAGSDVDAEVEEALPLEQALRALTHWHNVRRYPERMMVAGGGLDGEAVDNNNSVGADGGGRGLLEEEQDFFMRELEKMDFDFESVSDVGSSFGG